MFINFRKNIKNGYLTYLTLGLLFFLVILGFSFNFLHDHEPDFKIHHDCPGYQIFLLFNSIITFTLAIIFAQAVFSNVIVVIYEKPDLIFSKIYNSRSPPFQIY